ncbi:MAG: hypothetical protein U0V56_11680 [Actinomycetota bacterium]
MIGTGERSDAAAGGAVVDRPAGQRSRVSGLFALIAHQVAWRRYEGACSWNQRRSFRAEPPFHRGLKGRGSPLLMGVGRRAGRIASFERREARRIADPSAIDASAFAMLMRSMSSGRLAA